MRKKTFLFAEVLCCLAVIFCCVFSTIFAGKVFAYVNTGISSTDIAEIAKGEIGYSSKTVTKYCSWTSSDSAQRPASFISWCAYTGGISDSVIPRMSTNTEMLEYFRTANLFGESAYLDGTKKPDIGSLIFITSVAGDYSKLCRIGIVTQVSGMSVSFVEDGHTESVSSSTCSIYNTYILGYAFPNYTQEAAYQTGRYRLNEVMNFRTGPDTSYPIVKNSQGNDIQIPSYTSVTVTEIDGSWGFLVYMNKSGWIKLDWSEYIDTQDDNNEEISRDGEWLIVDVSSFQPEKAIDWNSLKSAGAGGVIIRIGGRYYGEANNHIIYDDEEFAIHYEGAKRAGLAVGTYFFSAAYTKERAQEEAQFVLDELSKGEYELDLPVFIDIEDIEANYKPHYAAGKQVCTLVVDSFCTVIEDAGYYAGVYCSKDFAEVLLEPSVFSGRATWIAQYHDSCTYGGSYHMWQYTRTGRLSGYSGNLDISKCYYDLPKYIKANGLNGFTPIEENEGWVIKVKPTCTNSGTEAVINDIGIEIAQRSISPLNHTLTQAVVIGKELIADESVGDSSSYTLIRYADYITDTAMQSSFSKLGGTIVEYCTSCKKVIETEYIPAISCSHEKATRKTERASTCSVQGISTLYCPTCEHTVSSKLLAFTAHNTVQTTQAATCEKEGRITDTCKSCELVVFFSNTGFAQHSGNWVTETPAYGLKAGTESCICTVCGNPATRQTEPLMMCDLDYDKTISASDARFALRIATKLDTADDVLVSIADIDNDESVTAADARIILRLSVKLEKYNEVVKKYYNITL